MNHYQVVVIGSGPAGLSALIWCRRLGLTSILLEKSRELGGQLHRIYNEIIDYPGLLAGEKRADGRHLASLFQQHVHQLNCEYRTECEVLRVNPESAVIDSTCGRISFDYLIVATGARERQLGIPGEQEMIARNETYSTSNHLDRLRGRRIAVVGGGDRAFEGALNASRVAKEVFLFHRSDRFRAREALVRPVRSQPNITLMTFCELKKIHGKDRVTGVRYRDHRSGEVKDMEIDVVLIRIGVAPNSHLVKDYVKQTNEGRVVTDRYGRTSHPRIYAAGDVATSPSFSSIANSVGQGMVAAKSIALTLQSGGKDQ
ncbi:MAG: NAD(P)/FAD-dependent oxidoreductase [Bacillaceae bacterium]|nr:NAD(P)/FAD-dependent oxidoreductase [Bacillaceae bacterium]